MSAAVRFLLLASFVGFAHAANNSAFVSQNVPAVMVPGQVYAVSVTMQNNGTTTWTPGTNHRLGSQNAQDNTTWGTNRVSLPAGTSIAPGASRTFSFNVTAPSTPGTYNFQWKMVQDGVEWFGALSTNVQVKVGLNDALFASQSVPPVMTPGQSYAVTVTMTNTGGSTWSTSGYRLGSQNPENNMNWGLNRVAPAATTPPGSNGVFNFNVTAPSTPGTYNFQWKMGQSGVEWFGGLSSNVAVKVGLDNAAFVSQSVPSTMVAGQSYAVSVTMQNTGSTTWASGTVGLGSQNPAGNTTWGMNKVNLTSAVAPSAQTTFNFNVTAPSTAGTYNFQWKMLEGTNGWFGAQSTNIAVNVTTGAPQNDVYFIHTDHLNTPRMVANSTGATVWRWDQAEPFGINAPDEDADGNSVAFEFPLRFPGQYADKETNLFYNYFRNYDTGAGRYVESDPIGLLGGPNTYTYVASNPIAYTDRLGLVIMATIGPSMGMTLDESANVSNMGNSAMTFVGVTSPAVVAVGAGPVAWATGYVEFSTLSIIGRVVQVAIKGVPDETLPPPPPPTNPPAIVRPEFRFPKGPGGGRPMCTPND